MSDIPVVILCGGKGTRVGQLTGEIPKPLIKVGEKPILWHVMKIYASQGFDHFILCLGYKGRQVKNYFKRNNREGWHIQFVDTGLESLKSQRIAQVKHLIKGEMFFLAYGDDVANINIQKLLKFHLRTGLMVTITVVRMISDFGLVEIGKKNVIVKFKEKPLLDKWMNGGFMVMNKKIFDYLKLGELEKEVFEELARQRHIGAYNHKGKWKAMNTLKDYIELNSIWNSGKAFWRIWEDDKRYILKSGG